MSEKQTINMIAAALGGEGGGVFTDWIISVAEKEQWLCQSTSLAGVAQRTGATIYYMELFPRGDIEGTPPVMSLFPAQADIDIAIASEIAEAVRMIQRGFVTKDRTTLIASDHRVYSITEKAELGNGIVDAGALQQIAQNYAKHCVHYDMLELANQHGAVISAVLFGALAGAEVLPFKKSSFEDVIRAGGKAVETNLAAFEASYQRVQSRGVETIDPKQSSDAEDSQQTFVLPEGNSAAGKALLARVKADFPSAVHEILYHGLGKLVDYQDREYAGQYLDSLSEVLSLDKGDQDHRLTSTTARYLALWMCFEDIPRVAQFKIRPQRMGGIRSEVKAEQEQLFYVTEFFSPRVEEMCALLPPGMAKMVMNSSILSKLLGLFAGGKKLRTNTVSIYFMLRFMAGLRRIRRYGLGFQQEHELISRWLDAVKDAAKLDPSLAQELAECGRLIKGYGDTRHRTSDQLSNILQKHEQNSAHSASVVASWRDAALKDDEGQALELALAENNPL